MSRMNEGQNEAAARTVSDIKEAATHVKENVRELGGQVRDVATQKYTDLRDQATQYYNDGRQRATEWEQGVEQYIKDQPLKAVLMAAGAGLLLGMIWKRV
jgi:ElaB/YqjD/DUF883 family membrane-anchored ribosome-binding protein